MKNNYRIFRVRGRVPAAKMTETLKDLRQQSKKTLAEVANVLGVSVSAVGNYENGHRQISIQQVLILANLYSTTAEEIIAAQINSLVGKTD